MSCKLISVNTLFTVTAVQYKINSSITFRKGHAKNNTSLTCCGNSATDQQKTNRVSFSNTVKLQDHWSERRKPRRVRKQMWLYDGEARSLKCTWIPAGSPAAARHFNCIKSYHSTADCQYATHPIVCSSSLIFLLLGSPVAIVNLSAH